MKECVYGWYPPARDILSKSYPSPVKSDTYTKECLYRHPVSRYADQKGIATPEPPYRASPPRSKSRSPTRHSACHQYRVKRHPPHTPTINLEIRGTSQLSRQETPPPSRLESPSVSRPVSADVKLFVPSTSKCGSAKSYSSKKPWSTEVPATHIPTFEEFLSKQADTTQSLSASSWQPASPPQSDVTSSFSERRDRIKSATTYRPRHSPPTRPVRSADPSRRTPVTVSSGPTLPTPPPPTTYQLADVTDLVHDLDLHVEEVPPTDVAQEPTIEQLGVDNPKDYDEELQKYGWRMEVPGDPLNIKRRCFSKRLPITMVQPEPEIPPNPPKAKAENWQTFFLNTIPRRPMTYTIHQEWTSEVLLAKRMELQKRDGELYKYRKTNFSFVY